MEPGYRNYKRLNMSRLGPSRSLARHFASRLKLAPCAHYRVSVIAGKMGSFGNNRNLVWFCVARKPLVTTPIRYVPWSSGKDD
jgi:hypothetical protein